MLSRGVYKAYAPVESNQNSFTVFGRDSAYDENITVPLKIESALDEKNPGHTYHLRRYNLQ